MEKEIVAEKHIIDSSDSYRPNPLERETLFDTPNDSLNTALHGEASACTNTIKDIADSSYIDVKDETKISNEVNSLPRSDNVLLHPEDNKEALNGQVHTSCISKSGSTEELNQTAEEVPGEEKEDEPVFDGTEIPELDTVKTESTRSVDPELESDTNTWPDKAVTLKNFVKEKGVASVSNIIRRLSGKKDDGFPSSPREEEKKGTSSISEGQKNEISREDISADSNSKDSLKAGERSTWNPFNYIRIGRDTDIESKLDQLQLEQKSEESSNRGRIIVYTKLGCDYCKEVRLFMHQKNLRFIEINIDIYPSRKLELEKNRGSCTVPCIYINDFVVGGLAALNAMDESGMLYEKINGLMNEEPSPSAPLPPLSGEDDESGSGKLDELVSIIKKMRESITIKDRFYKMRRFNNCFIGSEAVDFLSEDQYLERQEAVELGRTLADNHFFRHVSEENIFEDGNHLYRFLESDTTVTSQCYNIPSSISEIAPKAITEIASRLRLVSSAMIEAYVSPDGRHVDYRSIQRSEEFRRYLRTTEELQRVQLIDLSREEKLAFFINLYNMMAIHAILTLGYPAGALDRRKFFGDFKYIIGGSLYSLSAIQNGILRGNQRPPYNITKPFGPKDKRFKVALQYPEPLVHFALVYGTRSGPALRCYSPGNIDKELMEAGRHFLRNGGLTIDTNDKLVTASKILHWYNMDFGRNENEVLKHAANYLHPAMSETLLDLLASTQLKVVYQTYDWGLNC